MAIEGAPQESGSEVERAVMSVLLHNAVLLSRDEIVREVAGTEPRQAVEVRDAIDSLRDAGLVHELDGQFLLATRVARRADGLGL